MNDIILVISYVIYERIYFPHSVPNAIILNKKAGSEFPKNMLNSLLKICWKQMMKDHKVVTSDSLTLCKPLITSTLAVSEDRHY